MLALLALLARLYRYDRCVGVGVCMSCNYNFMLRPITNYCSWALFFLFRVLKNINIRLLDFQENNELIIINVNFSLHFLNIPFFCCLVVFF